MSGICDICGEEIRPGVLIHSHAPPPVEYHDVTILIDQATEKVVGYYEVDDCERGAVGDVGDA